MRWPAQPATPSTLQEGVSTSISPSSITYTKSTSQDKDIQEKKEVN